MIRREDWEAVYHTLIAEGPRGVGDPPPDADLLAYAAGELVGEDVKRIEEYLAYHPEVARVLAQPLPSMADDCLSPAIEAAEIGDAALDASWEQLRTRLEAAGALPSPVSPSVGNTAEGSGVRLRRFFTGALGAWRLSSATATVAALVAMSLYLGARADLARIGRELERPRIDFETRVLLPDGSRGAQSQMPILLPSDAEHLLLVPTLADHPRYSDYRVEIVRGQGEEAETVWSAGGVPLREDDDTFQIWVPRDFLLGDRHLILLYGVRDGERDLLETYTVRLAES